MDLKAVVKKTVVGDIAVVTTIADGKNEREKKYFFTVCHNHLLHYSLTYIYFIRNIYNSTECV